MSKEFLTIKEAAAAIGVSALTLRNWDNSGKFTASRHPINNYRVYKKAEVDMLIEDMRSKQRTIKKPKNQAIRLQIKHLE
jgi:DNA (cytosine-5)-methyltransferase 1